MLYHHAFANICKLVFDKSLSQYDIDPQHMAFYLVFTVLDTPPRYLHQETNIQVLYWQKANNDNGR